MDQIREVLSSEEIIEPQSPDYAKETQVWSAHKDLHPQLVARPKNTESLSKLLKVLNETNVEFNVRCGGCGSASSNGVLVSLSAFDHFEFNKEEEYVIVGAGQLWRHVDAKVEEFAPGYSGSSLKVGVGGSTLQGGVSWMSSEYGLASDPSNMLDAQVVKMDGSVIWAGESDPDLLWALRGGGGRFGVVTAFKFRAHKYPQDIYSGMIIFPRDALDVLAKRVPEFEVNNTDPKVAMHFYCLDLTNGAFAGKPTVPGLALTIYDAHGEKHGRELFKWALEIPGAKEMTKSMTYRQTNEQFGKQMMTAVVVPRITEDLIRRTWKWFDDTLSEEPELNAGTFVIIEMMQKQTFSNAKSRSATAYPRPQNGRHILQLGTGALNGCTKEVHRKAVDRLAAGAHEILDRYSAGNCLPRDFEEFHDPVHMFGENVERLREIKKRVDPRSRLNGAYSI